jgi:hypothetical protein
MPMSNKMMAMPIDKTISETLSIKLIYSKVEGRGESLFPFFFG